MVSIAKRLHGQVLCHCLSMYLAIYCSHTHFEVKVFGCVNRPHTYDSDCSTLIEATDVTRTVLRFSNFPSWVMAMSSRTSAHLRNKQTTIIPPELIVIKSPRYIGGDFLFLYRFIRRHRRRRCRRRRRPQTFVDAMTFEQFVGFLKFWHNSWPWPIDYLIRFGWFSSWPWPWIFKVKYGICYISAKNNVITTKRKANISIEIWASNVTIGFDLGLTLTSNFQGHTWNWLYLSQTCSVATNRKANISIGL